MRFFLFARIMSKITPELLKAIAPLSPTNKRDRFVPFLNEALPRYGIVSEFQVAAFLATACFESMYFQATKEGHARVGSKARAYQDKYWSTGFYGRGIFQTTHRANYLKLGQTLKASGVVDNENLFVEHPELLEQPKWAVESACVYWTDNKLDRYARQGLKGFFALQGTVNKGNPNKEALGYPERLAIYETARRVMPDDFNLSNSAAAIPKNDDANSAESPVDLATGGKPAVEQPPTPPQEANQTIVSVPPVQTEPPDPGIIGKIQTWYAAAPAFALSALGALWSWLQGAAVEIIVAFLIAAGIVAIVFIILNYRGRQNEKQRLFDAEQRQKDRDFELTKIQLESAANPMKQTVRLQPPPAVIPNNDVPAEEKV
jgi:putative chitinase